MLAFPLTCRSCWGTSNNEFRAVEKNHNDYDHLINHVTVQMDSNDFQLYTTPVVLTLQGELEDDEVEEEDEYDGEDYDDEEEEEFSLEELLAQEDEYDEDECDEDDEHDEEDDVERSAADNEEAAFLNESPMARLTQSTAPSQIYLFIAQRKG